MISLFLFFSDLICSDLHFIYTEQMDAECLGRKLLLTLSGDPCRTHEKQTVGTVTASQNMLRQLSLQALSSSLNAGRAKGGCLGRGEAFGCPPAAHSPERLCPFIHYRFDIEVAIQNGKPARHKNPGKMGKKLENGPRPEMAKKWPPKRKNGPQNGQNPILGSIFPFRRPFFGHFGPGAIFQFLSHFAGIFVTGRFPILCMATSIANLQSLIFSNARGVRPTIWERSLQKMEAPNPLF